MDKREAPRASQLLQRAVTLSLQAADAEEALEHATPLAYLWTHTQRWFGAARWLLDSAAKVAPEGGPGEARVRYHRGLLAVEVADYRTALVALEDAAEAAEALALDALATHAGQTLAETYARVGRTTAAEAWLDRARLRARRLEPIAAADFASNAGWAAWLAREYGTGTSADPLAYFSEALRFHQTHPNDAAGLANAAINTALGELQAGHTESAENALRLARESGGVHAGLAAWAEYADAWTALQKGEWIAAAAALEAVERRPKLDPELAYFARRRRGQALAQAGRPSAAAEAYEAAYQGMVGGSQLVGLGQGRADYLGRGTAVARDWARALIAAGSADEAFDVVVRANSVLTRSAAVAMRLASLSPSALESRRRRIDAYRRLRAEISALRLEWDAAPSDERKALRTQLTDLEAQADSALDRALASAGIRPIASKSDRGETERVQPKGEVELAAIGLDDGALTVLVRTPSGTTAHEFDRDALIRGALADVLPAPADNAPLLAVYASGTAASLEFHALPFGDKTLLDAFVVAYPAGVPSEGKREWSGRAVVVADPRHTLPTARNEAATIARAWPEEATEALVGAAAARDRVLMALEGASLFHFAGHGDRGETDGIDASLELADAAELRAGDVLGLSSPPTAVVLSSCFGTAWASTAASLPGLGMARSFLAAGSEAVIASPRPLSDRCAERWSQDFYRAYQKPSRRGFAGAYREATLAMRQQHPECDGTALRLVIR